MPNSPEQFAARLRFDYERYGKLIKGGPAPERDIISRHHISELRMRTIIDLPDRQIEALDRVGRSRKLSRAELIRQAVERYLQENLPAREEAFGLWQRSGVRRDGVAFQRRLRKEWKR